MYTSLELNLLDPMLNNASTINPKTIYTDDTKWLCKRKYTL